MIARLIAGLVALGLAVSACGGGAETVADAPAGGEAPESNAGNSGAADTAAAAEPADGEAETTTTVAETTTTVEETTTTSPYLVDQIDAANRGAETSQQATATGE